LGWTGSYDQFVEADGYGLAEIHGWLAGVGGDFDEQVAPGKIFAGEAVFFRTEDEGYSAAASELLLDDGREIGELDYFLLGLAVGEGPGADDQRAVGYGVL
jgi:hypothetical protein